MKWLVDSLGPASLQQMGVVFTRSAMQHLTPEQGRLYADQIAACLGRITGQKPEIKYSVISQIVAYPAPWLQIFRKYFNYIP